MTEDARGDASVAGDSSRVASNDALWVGRLVPAGREGNTLFARALKPGEEDTGEGINVRAGERLVIRAGDLGINLREVDAMSPKGLGGYAPVANTIWTWFTIVGAPTSFFLHLVSLARRLDAAHELWAVVVERLDEARIQPPVQRRGASFTALATAEMAVIALHRALEMLERLLDNYFPDIAMPETGQEHRQSLGELRRAFEHIDDRAEARVGMSRKLDLSALSIFDQPDFLESTILSYKEHSFNLAADMARVLLDSRQLVMELVGVKTRFEFTELNGGD